MKKLRIDPDYWLMALTTLVLLGVGLLCLFSMFYYRAASIRPGWNVIGYQMMMNRLASPLVIGLCLLLVVCVPKRMLPGRWLFLATFILLAAALTLSLVWGVILALVIILVVSLAFQLVILGLLLGGIHLKFQKMGFWKQLGSILIHAGFILFIMDFSLLHETRWHLAAFWASTVAICVGCLLSFYAPLALKPSGKE